VPAVHTVQARGGTIHPTASVCFAHIVARSDLHALIGAGTVVDVFRLRLDGSIICATVVDGRTLHPYAESGIDFCGTFHVPNNWPSAGSAGGRLRAGIGMAPSRDDSHGAAVLVNFATPSLLDAGADPASRLRAENVSVRGTIAFVSSADAWTAHRWGSSTSGARIS